MKTLLIGEYREGKLLDSTYELFGFAGQLGAETALLLVGSEAQLPAYGGTLYLGDAAACGEYNPDLHKQLILEAVRQEDPDYVVFLHSSYGWDLAPRIAAALKGAQISEVIALADGGFEVGCCNAKMRRTFRPAPSRRCSRAAHRRFGNSPRPGAAGWNLSAMKRRRKRMSIWPKPKSSSQPDGASARRTISRLLRPWPRLSGGNWAPAVRSSMPNGSVTVIRSAPPARRCRRSCTSPAAFRGLFSTWPG